MFRRFFKRKDGVVATAPAPTRKDPEYSVVEYPKAHESMRYMCRRGDLFLKRYHVTRMIEESSSVSGNLYADGFRTLKEAWAFIDEHKEQVSSPPERVHTR